MTGEFETRAPGVSNTVAEVTAGGVVQAGSIHGGVHLHRGDQTGMVVPRQLPPRRPLLNRTVEHGELERVVGGGAGPWIVVVTGQGGVGKTAFGVETAYRHLDRFPDGQLHVDLRAYSTAGPRPYGEVLRLFLRALGVPPDRIPASEDELAAEYRSRTADSRMLILLDNAGSARQVRPLIPASPHCVVIVTSRGRLSELALDGARHITLDCFRLDHAVDLLRTVAGMSSCSRDQDTTDQDTADHKAVDHKAADHEAVEWEAVERVADLCHRLPLALSIAAATVATRSHQSFATLAEELTARAGVLGLALGELTVREVMNVSVEHRSVLAGAVYRVMSLLPSADWSLDAAAAALEESVEGVRVAVDELVEANLLIETTAGRFGYHDLLRQHARHLAETILTEPARDGALRAMAEFYRDRCLALDLVHRPTQRKFSTAYGTARRLFATPVEATAWFRVDREAVLAALGVAADRGWHDLVSDIGEAVWRPLLVLGHYHDVIAIQERWAVAARHLGDRVQEAVALTRASFGERHLGRLDAARQRCTAALALADTYAAVLSPVDRAWIESSAAHARGIAAEAAGDLGAAQADYERAIDAERLRMSLAPGSTGYGLALRNRDLAWLHARRGDVAAAHRVLDEVVETMREIMHTTGDASGYARTVQLRGTIHMRAGEWDLARTTLKDVESVLESCGAQRWLRELYESMSDVDVQLGDIDSARTHLSAARELALADGHTDLASTLSQRIDALPTHSTVADPTGTPQ